MAKAKGIGFLVLIGVGAIVSYFTVGGADVAKWNDKVIALEERFGLDWKTFEPSINPWLEGKPLDVAAMEAAFTVYSGAVGQTSGEMRRELPPDDATWARGRGWALSVALLELPYYWDTNPEMVEEAQRVLAELAADPD